MVDWSVPVTTGEMYGSQPVRNDAIDELLDRSRDPTPASSLYDVAGRLGAGPGRRVLDIGGRDAAHALELVRRYGCRVVSVDPSPRHVAEAEAAVGVDPVGELVEVRRGSIEAIPADDDSFDLVWARDVLSHVAALDRGLEECWRVLVASGAMLVYGTFATPWLEPAEKARLCAGLAVRPERLAVEGFEDDVERAGFAIESVEVVGSQWREAWEEDGSRRTSRQLLHAARLIRAEGELAAELGPALYKIELANALWGVYQMLGKLEPRIYVLRR